jgi:membrane-bound lytic murein transglycosylase MltF
MSHRTLVRFAGVCLLSLGALACRPEPPDAAETPVADQQEQVDEAVAAAPQTLSDSALRAVTMPRLGDLDSMRIRRQIRVLVVPNQTHYFVDRGRPRGLAVDAAALFEAFLNQKYRTGVRPIRLVLVPVRHDQLIPALVAGRGDVVVAGLTVTPEREALMDLSNPVLTDISEIVVTGSASPPLTSLDDLAGKEVFVRPSTAIYGHLQALNADFVKRGLAPIRLRAAPAALQDEDLLEMLSAGLVPLVVMNDYLATFWKQVLPGIALRPDLVVASGSRTAWMLRKGSPLLKADIDAFLAKYPKGSAARNMLLQKYLKNTDHVVNATSDADIKRFQRTEALFKQYGSRYDLDYLLMMAQGYQESRLDQDAKSSVGAVGVMQVMPATGKSLRVGDIHQIDPNIHAGVKYIRSLIDTYFSGDSLDALNRTLFAFAAYNAGPGRIAGLRRRAAARGLDPNQWSDNVEMIAAEEIGRETVTYVDNIFKYYVAYSLLRDQAEERAAARKRQ